MSLKKRERALLMKRENIRHEHGIKFLETLNRYRDKIKDRVSGLEAGETKQAGELRAELNEMERHVRQELADVAENRFSDRYRPFDPELARVGGTVFVLPLEKEGRIEKLDDRNKKALVILGTSFRSRFIYDDLRLPLSRKKVQSGKDKNHAAPSRGGAQKQEDAAQLTIQTAHNTIDIRGKRAHEALDIMERGIDTMLREGIPAAIVIHGHGTGVLKTAVRENLTHSFYELSFRPGNQDEGGDGVTIVFLNS